MSTSRPTPDSRVCGATADSLEHLGLVREALARARITSADAPARVMLRYSGQAGVDIGLGSGLGVIERWCHEDRPPDCARCPLRYHCQEARSVAPPASEAPTFADLFAGAGGLSLGFEQVGWSPKVALDVDPWFMETYRYNRPAIDETCDVVTADLWDWLDDDPVVAPVDALVGGVPCQPFSNANRQRRSSDPRKDLFLAFFSTVSRFRPKAIVIENVAGFRERSDEVMDLFDDLGFAAADIDLEASAFGMPQRRRRIVFLAFSHHAFGDAKDRLRAALDEVDRQRVDGPPRTLRHAIADLPALDACRVAYAPGHESAEAGHALDWIEGPGGAAATLLFNHKARYNNDRDIEIFGLMSEGDDSRAPQIEHLMPYVGRQHIFADKYHRLRWDRPSRTITAHMRYDCNTYIHPAQARGLTAREAARVQGFSDDYAFVGTFQRIYQQIGNAVPPPVARVLASAVRVGLP